MSDYKMPAVRRGEIVDWFEGGVRNDERGCAAIVKVVGHNTLHLKVFGLDHDFDQTCVKHIDDPAAKEYDRVQEGGWDLPKPVYNAVNPAPKKDK